MADVHISNHAYIRMKERDGIGKKDVAGSFYKYIVSELTAYNQPRISIRIYGEMVHCFMNQPNGELLLTVFWVLNN